MHRSNSKRRFQRIRPGLLFALTVACLAAHGAGAPGEDRLGEPSSRVKIGTIGTDALLHPSS